MKTFLALSIALCTFISVSADCATCAGDERCSNDTCDCNRTVYTLTVSDPSPIFDCNGGQINLFLSKCWLEKNGYSTSNIRLNSNTCLATREVVNNTAQMTFHRPLTSNDCGNTVQLNTTHVTYANILHIFGTTDPFRIRNDAVANISCSFPLNIKTQLNVTLRPIIGSSTLIGPGTNTAVSVNMVVYTDNTFTTLLSEDQPLYVESTIYVSVFIANLDVDTFKLKVLNISASASESGPTYNLLQNGCPSTGITADLMSVLSNGNSSESRFAMKVFQISGSSKVFLSAEVQLCLTDCKPDCNIKSKSVSTDINTAIVSVSLTADEHYVADSATGFSMSWTLNSIFLSIFLVKLI